MPVELPAGVVSAAGVDVVARSVTVKPSGPYAAVLPGDATTATPAGVDTGKLWDWGGAVWNVKAAGLAGDNATDDQPKYQTLVNSLPQLAGRFYGGMTYFPASDPYIFNSSITPVHNLVMAGPQLGFAQLTSNPRPICKLKSTIAGVVILEGGSGLYGVTVSGLSFTGDTSSASSKAIHATTANGWTVDNVYCSSWGGQAIHIEGGTVGTFSNLFVDGSCSVRGGWADYVGCTQIEVNDAVMFNITSTAAFSISVPQVNTGFIAGIKIGGGGTIAATNCIGHLSEVGIVVQLSSGTTVLNRLIGCRADHNQTHGFVIAGTGNDVLGCLSYRNAVNADNTYDGFVVTRGDNNFIGNRVAMISADTSRMRYGFTDSSADGGGAVNTYSKNRSAFLRQSLYNHTGSDGFVTDDAVGTGIVVTTTGNGYDTSTRDQKRRIAMGYIAETMEPGNLQTGVLIATQQVQYGLIYLFKGEVITNLYAHTTIAGAGQTSVWMALFNSALAQVAITGDVKAVFAAAAGIMVCPLTGSYTVPADGAYYIALLGVGGTQPTVVRGGTLNTATDAIGAGLRPFGQQTGQATMPNPAVVSQTTLALWMRAG